MSGSGSALDLLKEKKVHVESYGCTYNHADARRILRIAELAGCRRVPIEEAEVIIIATCTVIAATERAMVRRIKSLTDRPVIATGCMPVVQAALLREIHPDIHLLLPDELERASERIGAMVDEGVGVVQAGPGCLGHCSYCITRCARGSMKSHSIEEIATEARLLVAEGAKEIQLTGQDISAWGTERGESLYDLCRTINEVEGDFFVRLGMMNPATAIPRAEEIAAALALPKIFSFAHLPVQSGSARVLEAMQRGYTPRQASDLVRTLQRKVPGIRISTDLIAGFPTETDLDLEETVALMREMRAGKVNITRFSRREGTPAASLKDLPDRIKKDRSRRLTIEANAFLDGICEGMIGECCEVMVTEKKRQGSSVCRDKTYQNIIIGEDLPLGFRCTVRITGHRRHYLTASRI